MRTITLTLCIMKHDYNTWSVTPGVRHRVCHTMCVTNGVSHLQYVLHMGWMWPDVWYITRHGFLCFKGQLKTLFDDVHTMIVWFSYSKQRGRRFAWLCSQSQLCSWYGVGGKNSLGTAKAPIYLPLSCLIRQINAVKTGWYKKKHPLLQGKLKFCFWNPNVSRQPAKHCRWGFSTNIM